MKQELATVIYNKEILRGGPHRTGWSLAGHLMKLRSPEIASEAKPGQFIMVHCGGEYILPRPFSIHWADKDDIALFFAVLKDGKGTNWLARRKKGDTIELPMLQSLGNGFSVLPDSKKLLLVAGGMGLAPLCFLAHQAVREKRSLTLLLGAAVSPLYSGQAGNLLPPGIKMVTATEDGIVGHHGLITDLVPDYIDWADQVFACGPLPMYKTMARMPGLKNKPVQVSLEVRMACGRGICYGCTIKSKQGLKKVCHDGPVFELNDILWDELNSV